MTQLCDHEGWTEEARGQMALRSVTWESASTSVAPGCAHHWCQAHEVGMSRTIGRPNRPRSIQLVVWSRSEPHGERQRRQGDQVMADCYPLCDHRDLRSSCTSKRRAT